MHKNEQWQEYAKSGAPLKNGGRPGNHSEEAEARTDLYGVSCVWLYRITNGSLEILFQRRSEYVDRYAGDWDISAAGHVNYEETPLSAAVRETREEIGASLEEDDLIYVMTFNNGRRIANIYLCDYTSHPDEFRFDDKEVSEVKWVPLKDLDEFWHQKTKAPLAEDEIQYKIISKILTEIADGNYQE